MRCRFYCCWCCYYTTAKANAANIFAVGVDVTSPFLLLLVLLLHYGEDKCCPNFRRWCRRCVAVFTAVGAAITLRRGQMPQKIFAVGVDVTSPFYCCWCCYYTTARVNAAQIFAVGVGVALPFYCFWCYYYTTARVNAAQIFAVGEGVTMPFYCWCC